MLRSIHSAARSRIVSYFSRQSVVFAYHDKWVFEYSIGSHSPTDRYLCDGFSSMHGRVLPPFASPLLVLPGCSLSFFNLVLTGCISAKYLHRRVGLSATPQSYQRSATVPIVLSARNRSWSVGRWS